MKVNNQIGLNKVELKFLPTGSCFIDGMHDEPYIVTDGKGVIAIKCVGLSSGTICQFDRESVVMPVDAEVIITQRVDKDLEDK